MAAACALARNSGNKLDFCTSGTPAGVPEVHFSQEGPERKHSAQLFAGRSYQGQQLLA
jgi:hypothetical protein